MDSKDYRLDGKHIELGDAQRITPGRSMVRFAHIDHLVSAAAALQITVLYDRYYMVAKTKPWEDQNGKPSIAIYLKDFGVGEKDGFGYAWFDHVKDL